VVSSVSCRTSLHLPGMKNDFVWADSAGKRTSCDVLFVVAVCSALHCSDELIHKLIHCYQLLHFAVVHGLVITVRFGSSSDQNPCSSLRRFLAITHSFKVTRKRLKCLENAFPAINFSKFSCGGPADPSPWASRLRRSQATGSAGRRSADINPVLSGTHAHAPRQSVSPRTPMHPVYSERK